MKTLSGKWAIVIIFILALINLGWSGVRLARALDLEVTQDWRMDCYGTRVEVEQLELYHFAVSCNGMQVESVEVEDKPKPKQSKSEKLMSEGYPAPGDITPTIEPYPAPATSIPFPTYWAPTIKPPCTTWPACGILGYLQESEFTLKSGEAISITPPVPFHFKKWFNGLRYFYIPYKGKMVYARPIN